MTELSPKLRDAIGHVDAEWSPERADQTWRGLRVKRTRRAVVRTGASAVAIALVVGGAYWLAQDRAVGTSPDQKVADAPQPEVTPLPPEPTPEVAPLAVLEDDTVVTAEEAESEVQVIADAADRAEVRVVRGKARFKSPKAPDRDFRVVSGDVKIDVYATEFSVARYDGSTEVWAVEGVLRIEWHGKTQEIRTGEHARFPPDAIEAPAGELVRDTTTKRPQSARETVRDLMQAADLARERQKPREAIRPLGRVIKEYPKDSRAPMAAFTLGRILLEDLDEPRKAARMFKRTRALAPRSPLAEDALAREAESWAKAGNADMARDRAEQYLEKYPDGHKVRAVRQYVE